MQDIVSCIYIDIGVQMMKGPKKCTENSDVTYLKQPRISSFMALSFIMMKLNAMR